MKTIARMESGIKTSPLFYCKNPSVCLLVFWTTARKTHCHEYCMTQVSNSSEEKFVLRRTMTTPVVTTSLCAAALLLHDFVSKYVTTQEHYCGRYRANKTHATWDGTEFATLLHNEVKPASMKSEEKQKVSCILEIKPKKMLYVTMFSADNNEWLVFCLLKFFENLWIYLDK